MSTSTDDIEMTKQHHLDWSNKQKRILTGGDRADEFYTADRGYPFEETELPHYHLLRGDIHPVFQDWKTTSGTKRERDGQAVISPLVGAWTRLLFFGGWEHTSHKDERTFNLQTRNLFIDLRIPRTREMVLPKDKKSLDEYNQEELRLYARQHVFAGYTQLNQTDNKMDLVCTRHHCMDWNFVGTPRTRPNKWYAELPQKKPDDAFVVETWKEWAFAQDEHGQHYYCEQWERLPEGQGTPLLALKTQNGSRDGMILCVGDHFNYVLARDLSGVSVETYADHASLGAVVDAALDQGDLATAKAFLSMQGGHGRISQRWVLDCAIEPWKEQTAFWDASSLIVTGSEIGNCSVEWNHQTWKVFDTTFTTVDQVSQFLKGKP
jgi:hypothetical protein